MQYKTWAPLSGLSTYMFIIQKMPYPKYVLSKIWVLSKKCPYFMLYISIKWNFWSALV